MKSYFILMISALVFSEVFQVLAQTEPISIHQQQWQEHRHLSKAASLFEASGKDIRPLVPAKTTELLADVFGYLPDWQYQQARNYLQYDLLSHIGAFDFHVNSNGDISNPAYWPWTDVINAAHDNGTKVILVAVNFNKDEIRNILTNAGAKSNFFNQAKAKILDFNLDGINIDFESLYMDDRGALLNQFMADLTSFMHQEIPGTEVSFAGPAVNWGGWDLAGLANACDYIFIMGYAFSGSWSSSSGAGAPLTGGSINITNTVTVQYDEVTQNQPQKLFLGVPYYGSRWQTETNTANAAVVNYENHPRFYTAREESDTYGRKWDSASQTPWYVYKMSNDWFQVWYDDAQSLGLKYDLADSKSLRGVGMWALGYDGSRMELWNELRQRYLPESQPMPSTPVGVITKSNPSDESVYLAIRQAAFSDGFIAYWGTDGITFPDSVYIDGYAGYVTGLNTDQLYFFKTRAQNERGLSSFSAVTATTISDSATVLIVDGFERNDSGHNQFNYVIRHARAFEALGYAVATAQNEAVIDGTVELSDYAIVDWLLGDEGSANTSFNATEKNRIRNYLQDGGSLFVSGSEIGWDLVANGSDDDKTFYHDYLKADYIADAPNNSASTYYDVNPVTGSIFEGINSFSFDDGNYGTYNIDWPDAITAYGGSELCLSFDGVPVSNGGSAVAYCGLFADGTTAGKIVYLTFPFESINTVDNRISVLSRIMHFFNSPVSIKKFKTNLSNFKLFQNYPNPFNPDTRIKYTVGAIRKSSVHIKLTVFNMLGQKVRTLVNRKQEAGSYSVTFNATGLASGVYYYTLYQDGNAISTKKMILLR